MLRILIILITMLVVNGEAVSKPASLPRQHIVAIQAFSFQPQRTIAAPGDTIVWVNLDIVPHTVTADGGTWRSQPLEEGESWEVIVDNDGMLSYFCEFHPHMTGVLATR
jgi:plastocyanin